MKFLLLLISFFSGSIPFSYILYRLFKGEDIRKRGSGNVGATNALRSGGVGIGIAVAILDISKSAIPVYFSLPYGREFAALCGLFAVFGHCFTPWLSFRGGKGVASFIGAGLVSSFLSTLFSLILFLFGGIISGMVSLGSLLLAISMPIFSLFIYGYKIAIIQTLTSLIIIFRHRENIERIFKGKEGKIWRGFM